MASLLTVLLFIQPTASALFCHAVGDSTETCAFCYRHERRAGCIAACSFPNTTCGDEDAKSSCCCKTNYCNNVIDEGPSATALVFIVLGVVLFIGIVIGLIVLCVLRQRKRTMAKTYTPVEAGDAVIEKEDVSSACDSTYKATDQETSMIEHEDFSMTQVEPMLETDDKQELLDSLVYPQPIPGYDEFKQTPHITKLVTYGTTDTITICEDLFDTPKDIPHDETGFCAQLLAEMINNGPRQFHFELEQLKRVLEIGKGMFAAEPALLRVQVPCTVYGDIHGQYSDLHRWLNVNGWPNKRRCLFLGDFVDRGSHGVEVMAMICCLKKVFPAGIYVCRGNHEEETLNKTYSFFDEVQHRFKDTAVGEDNIYMYFKRVFMYLPLAALIGRRILGMHGGISPKLRSLRNIEEIRRPIDDFTVGSLACDLVWSDPNLVTGASQYSPNYDREPKAGIGQLFSSKAVQEVCKRLDVDLIVRGHQAPLHGYARWAGGRLLTLFSAPGYKGVSAMNVNKGACMDCSETGELTIKQIQVSEEFRQKRIADVQHREQMLKK